LDGAFAKGEDGWKDSGKILYEVFAEGARDFRPGAEKVGGLFVLALL
jgi:hypothetical protein